MTELVPPVHGAGNPRSRTVPDPDGRHASQGARLAAGLADGAPLVDAFGVGRCVAAEGGTVADAPPSPVNGMPGAPPESMSESGPKFSSWPATGIATGRPMIRKTVMRSLPRGARRASCARQARSNPRPVVTRP